MSRFGGAGARIRLKSHYEHRTIIISTPGAGTVITTVVRSQAPGYLPRYGAHTAYMAGPGIYLPALHNESSAYDVWERLLRAVFGEWPGSKAQAEGETDEAES